MLVDDPGIWFGITTGLVVLAFVMAGLAHVTPSETAVAAIATGGLAAARLPGPATVALGVITWAFYTGFTENTFGQLTFATADLERLGLFAVATVLVSRGVRGLAGEAHRRG